MQYLTSTEVRLCRPVRLPPTACWSGLRAAQTGPYTRSGERAVRDAVLLDVPTASTEAERATALSEFLNRHEFRPDRGRPVAWVLFVWDENGDLGLPASVEERRRDGGWAVLICEDASGM